MQVTTIAQDIISYVKPKNQHTGNKFHSSSIIIYYSKDNNSDIGFLPTQILENLKNNVLPFKYRNERIEIKQKFDNIYNLAHRINGEYILDTLKTQEVIIDQDDVLKILTKILAPISINKEHKSVSFNTTDLKNVSIMDELSRDFLV